MASSNKVLVKFLADTDGINKGVAQVNGQLERFGESAKKMAAGLLAGFAADKILDIGKSAVLAASDFNEMASKVDQVFGQSSTAVKTWADDAAVNFGLTKTAALDAASTFGVLGDKAGLSGKDLSDFSTGLGSLAADMASFSNTSVDDAIAAIGSGLRGEAEPLRAFGVLLDDATLKQEAMKLGIYQGNGALTSQQKILAAQAAIYDQTSKAQGDFARTSGGLANQMRIVQAEMGNLSIALGQGLLQGFGGTTEAGKSLITALQQIEPAVRWTGQAIGEAAAPLAEVIGLVGNLSLALDNLSPKFGPVSVGAGDLAYGLNPLYWATKALGAAAGQMNDNLERFNGTKAAKQQEELTAEFQRAALVADAYAGKLSRTSQETRDEAYATKQATDAQKELNAAFEQAQAARSWVLALDAAREANEAFTKQVKESGTTLDAHTAKGRANRDAIVNAFADNERAARAWGDQFNKSTEEVVAKADEMNVKTVKALKKAGYKKADVEEFLGANGLWTQGMTDIAGQVRAGKAGMTKAGKDIGQGLISGLEGTINAAREVGGRIANAAEQGARDASETHSPSKRWYLIGLDLTEGLKQGLTEGQRQVEKLTTDSFDALSLKIKSRVTEVPKAVTEAYTKQVEHLKSVLDTQGSIIQQGLDAIKSMSDGFVSQVLGNITIQTKDAQGNDLTPEQIVAALGFDIDKQKQAVAAIATNIGKSLPPALLTQVLNMAPDSAIALANFLGANPAMLQQLTANYASLATETETTLGIPMGLAWAKVGDQSALKAIKSAKARISDEADDFKTYVQNKLHTTVTIDVKYNISGDSVQKAVNDYIANNGRP